MSSLVKFVEEQFVEKKDLPSFSSGDTITVYYEIREGDKTRTQFFKGVVYKEEVLVQQRHLPLEKCLDLLELKGFSRLILHQFRKLR